MNRRQRPARNSRGRGARRQNNGRGNLLAQRAKQPPTNPRACVSNPPRLVTLQTNSLVAAGGTPLAVTYSDLIKSMLKQLNVTICDLPDIREWHLSLRSITIGSPQVLYNLEPTAPVRNRIALRCQKVNRADVSSYAWYPTLEDVGVVGKPATVRQVLTASDQDCVIRGDNTDAAFEYISAEPGYITLEVVGHLYSCPGVLSSTFTEIPSAPTVVPKEVDSSSNIPEQCSSVPPNTPELLEVVKA